MSKQTVEELVAQLKGATTNADVDRVQAKLREMRQDAQDIPCQAGGLVNRARMNDAVLVVAMTSALIGFAESLRPKETT